MSTPPPLPLLHSCLGIASFILSLVALIGFVFIVIMFVAGKISTLIILIMACIIIAMMWLLTLGYFYPSLKDMGIPEITFSVLGCLFSISGLLTIFGIHQILH